jgi:hypothetical protein
MTCVVLCSCVGVTVAEFMVNARLLLCGWQQASCVRFQYIVHMAGTIRVPEVHAIIGVCDYSFFCSLKYNLSYGSSCCTEYQITSHQGCKEFICFLQ